jgi:catechol 2,3-dioxygenase-like lactoylglutathione lyase family enzyme
MVKPLAALLALIPIAAHAQTVAPWQETMVSVRAFEPATRLFVNAGKWRVVQTGKMARTELNYWHLPTHAKGTFQLLCAPKAATGCIRFVRFTGVTQRPIRRAARPWDTGGIFSIMVRSDNVPALFEQALALGWWAEDEPIALSFRGSELKNVVLNGPDGINLAVYERSSPPFTAFPVGRISQAFNSMRFVKDQPSAADFYRKQLGFQVLFDDDATPVTPTPSNFSVPLNYTPKIKRHAAAMQPVPGETGRVEVMQLVGFEGADLSEYAAPPNFGILSVRYPVTGLELWRKQVEANGIEISYAAEKVPVAGLGVINLFAIRDHDGAITEFYEGVR